MIIMNDITTQIPQITRVCSQEKLAKAKDAANGQFEMMTNAIGTILDVQSGMLLLLLIRHIRRARCVLCFCCDLYKYFLFFLPLSLLRF